MEGQLCDSAVFINPFSSKDGAISHLHLHGDCDFLLCADQCSILHRDVSRGAPGLRGCRCGKNMN